MLEGPERKTVPWRPRQVGGKRGGVEVYRTETVELRAGDRIRWTRNDTGLGLVNSDTAEVASVRGDRVSFRLTDGRTLELGKNDSQLRHVDHAWASTVHAFQGRTVDNVIAVMEANHPHLTTQKSFYVEISRARHRAELVTDDAKALRETLEAATGERVSALEGIGAAPEKALDQEKTRGQAVAVAAALVLLVKSCHWKEAWIVRPRTTGGALMKYFAGLDVSLEWTSVCVVDDEGEIVREARVLSEPDALVAFFSELGVDVTRIALEAGPLSQWLHDGLAEADLPVVCAETRQLQAVLSATVNKSDRNDARGIAQMVRVNLIRPVHVKTLSSQHRRMLLTNRKFMLKQLCDAEANIRGTLRNFGLKVGKVSRRGFEARVLELVDDRATLACVVEPMLRARAALLAGFDRLHRMVLDAVRGDAVCRRLMTVPGVGPVTALTFRATVDVPARFARSRAVGAHFGLTPRKWQSGEIDRMGRISRCGDEMMRTALYEAANALLTRTRRWSWLNSPLIKWLFPALTPR